MTERIEGNPLKREIARHLLEKEKREVSPRDSRISAFVGASTEMVIQMMETGIMKPPPPEWDDDDSLPNDFMVYPTVELLPQMQHVTVNERLKEALEDPDTYIRSECISLTKPLALEHHFMTKLGLSLDNKDAYDAAIGYLVECNPERTTGIDLTPEISERLGLNQIEAFVELLPYVSPTLFSQVDLFAAAARERSGFMIGIDKEFPNRVLGLDNQYWAAARLSFGPQGMPYQAIAAIEPLGLHEERFLNALRK